MRSDSLDETFHERSLEAARRQPIFEFSAARLFDAGYSLATDVCSVIIPLSLVFLVGFFFIRIVSRRKRRTKVKPTL